MLTFADLGTAVNLVSYLSAAPLYLFSLSAQFITLILTFT